jgi:hypothetical protein
VALLCGATVACLSGEAQPIVRVSEAGPTPSACDPAGPVALYYRNVQPTSTADGIDFLFKVQNRTGADLALSSLTVRYYFTSEITPPGQTTAYYADTCCSAPRTGFTADVLVTANALTPATPTADHYLEIAFDAAAGTIATGDSVQVEPAFYAPNHGETVTLTNDYSYVAGATGTQADWDHCPTACGAFGSCVMTAYVDGALVWGTPP